MKMSKKIISLFLVLLTVFGCFAMSLTANAATATAKTLVLKKQTEFCLGGQGSETYKFTVPETDQVYVTFYACRGQSVGKFFVTVKNSAGTTVAKKTVTFKEDGSSSDQRLFMDLKKGTYKLTIKTTGDTQYPSVEFAIREKLTKSYATTALKLNATAKTLTLDDIDGVQLTATQTPSYTDDKVTWTTSNKNVVTVKNGKLTAVGLGTATVTAKSGTKTAKCKVTVTEIALIKTDRQAESLKSFIKYVPKTDGGKWSVPSAYRSIGKVSSAGKFTPLDYGTVKVNFKNADGKYFRFYIFVVDPVMITDASEYFSSSSHGIRLSFQNFTDKKVSYMKIRFIEYNAQMKKINDNIRYFKDKTIQPFGEATLKCKVKDATRQFEAVITEIRFTDGTVWKNF